MWKYNTGVLYLVLYITRISTARTFTFEVLYNLRYSLQYQDSGRIPVLVPGTARSSSPGQEKIHSLEPSLAIGHSHIRSGSPAALIEALLVLPGRFSSTVFFGCFFSFHRNPTNTRTRNLLIG